ncbi:DedA family protein [Vibrio cholerae]|uniref:DedA family protein n=1 Tax=Vibrio cholerae TaxID=666 RepID=UPI0028D91FE6|nr:DedA family protein [Vibrio cholerae]ELJ8484582.1 DedA family protein [Vibrio cholerae]ELK0390396.1 DedA family protein [Vibrio cholerae]HDL9486027.1 DedA family protein [Vibrio cholerae]
MDIALGQWISVHSDSPVWLFIGIVLLSYLLEDVAIVTAAGLASQHITSLPLALMAVFVGIATGDVALYYLGRYCRYFRTVRYRLLTNPYFRLVRRRLLQRPFINLFVIRFIPGLRTVGFTLSGYVAMPLRLFLTAVLVATALWTVLVFFTVYQLGSQAWFQASEYRWWLLCLLVVLLLGFNRLLSAKVIKEIA